MLGKDVKMLSEMTRTQSCENAFKKQILDRDVPMDPTF